MASKVMKEEEKYEELQERSSGLEVVYLPDIIPPISPSWPKLSSIVLLAGEAGNFCVQKQEQCSENTIHHH